MTFEVVSMSGTGEPCADARRRFSRAPGRHAATAALLFLLAALAVMPATAQTQATLSALSLGAGLTLNPAFDPATTEYRAWAANGVASATVTATPSHAGAAVAIAGAGDAGTPRTATLGLAPGRNTISIRVTAADGNATRTYTVAYATSDGTATAGADYEAVSSTLTFARGEISKTISVAVIDDSHDEGAETFTLTLSNPSDNAWLADATAVGTIENTDAMPAAWLARFGRGVADQVLRAVEGRFAAARTPGAAVSLAGQAIGGAVPAEARSGLADGEAVGLRARTVSERELLTGSSFALTGGRAGDGTLALWGRGAISRFDGREGEMSLDGRVTSAMLGADFGTDAWTAGLLIAQSLGSGEYRGSDSGDVESTLTGVYPYGRFMVNERVAVWGMAGYAAGKLELAPDKPQAGKMETDMTLATVAAGVRGVVLAAPAEGGVELALKSDALAVRTNSGRVRTPTLAAAETHVTRLRLGVEGTWRSGGPLAPRFELGLRHDGGDAETGFGVDIGLGLAWSDAASGLATEVSARGLLTHEADGFGERGLAGSLSWQQRPGTGRGVSLGLRHAMGGAASGGADALFGRETLDGLAANDAGLENRSLGFDLGYGFGAFGGRFTATPEFGFGLADGQREYRLGWRLGSTGDGPLGVELELTGDRRESANDDAAAHELKLRGSLRW